MWSYEKEQKELKTLLDEVLTDEECPQNTFDDESDNDESDHEERLDHESDSEQDISDNEGDMDYDKSFSTRLSFIGKDKSSYWKKHAPQVRNVRTRKENIIKRLPGPALATRSLKNPTDIWSYFINEEIISIIVDSTNKYIESVAGNYSRIRDANPTNPIEIQALIGLLYLAGASKGNRLNTEDMWRTDGYGIEIFHLTMSLQRFRFLLRCIRFDDKQTRLDRQQIDKLAAVRDILSIFQTNCSNGYYHSEFVTVDEMLPAFRGKCSFRQCIPSKPNKYGLKIFALCDAKMFYTSKIEIYVGNQPDGPYKVSNGPMDVVLRLCQDISGSGRNVTMDNWFTSLPLIRTLLNEHRLTVIGTIRKNKRELPIEFSKPVTRSEHTSMFGFTQEATLLSYIPRKGKNVLMVSTLHHDDEIDMNTGNLNKPVIITDYNSTKGGVDTVDKLCASYSCSRNTRRWPMVLFYSFLNIAGINSQIVFTANNPEKKIVRRHFIREMANGLIQPHLKARATIATLPRSLKLRLQSICGIDKEENLQQNARPGRCAPCGSKKNRKTRFSCYKCHTFLCLDHLTAICTACQENVPQME